MTPPHQRLILISNQLLTQLQLCTENYATDTISLKQSRTAEAKALFRIRNYDTGVKKAVTRRYCILSNKRAPRLSITAIPVSIYEIGAWCKSPRRHMLDSYPQTHLSFTNHLLQVPSDPSRRSKRIVPQASQRFGAAVQVVCVNILERRVRNQISNRFTVSESVAYLRRTDFVGHLFGNDIDVILKL